MSVLLLAPLLYVWETLVHNLDHIVQLLADTFRVFSQPVRYNIAVVPLKQPMTNSCDILLASAFVIILRFSSGSWQNSGKQECLVL